MQRCGFNPGCNTPRVESISCLGYGIDAAFAKKSAKLFGPHPDKRKRVESALKQLAVDPRYPSLATKKYDEPRDIWQSYIEQGTPAAWRVWWIWDPDAVDTIIVLSFGPHP